MMRGERTEIQSSGAAEQQNSRAAEQQSSRAIALKVPLHYCSTVPLLCLSYFLLTIYCLLFAPYSWAQVGFGVSMEPGAWERQRKEDEEKKLVPDAYAVEIAGRFSKNPEEIAKLFSDGFGRKETIRIFVISAKANVAHTEIVKLRNRRKTFRDIAKKYNLDHSLINDKTKEIIRNVRYSIAISTPTDAGVIENKYSIATSTPTDAGAITESKNEEKK